MESISSHGRAKEQLLGHQMRSTCFVAKQTTSTHCSSSKPRRRTTTTTRESARKFKMKPSKSNRCEMKQTRKKMSLLLLMLMLLVKSINVFASAGNQTELRPSSAETTTTTTMLKVLAGGNNGDLLSIEKAIRSRDNNNNKLAGNNDTTAISGPEQTLEMPMRLRQQLASLAAENMAARAREATQDKDEDEETRRRRKEKEQFLKFLSTTNFQAKSTNNTQNWKSRRRRQTSAEEEPLMDRPRRASPAAQSTATDQAKQPVILALLNGQASLECNLQPPDADDAVSLVLWYKDNSMVPIYSVDARAAPVQLARHKPGAWLEGRSSLRIIPPEPPVPAEATRQTSRFRRRVPIGEDEENNNNDEDDDDDDDYGDHDLRPSEVGGKNKIYPTSSDEDSKMFSELGQQTVPGSSWKTTSPDWLRPDHRTARTLTENKHDNKLQLGSRRTRRRQRQQEHKRRRPFRSVDAAAGSDEAAEGSTLGQQEALPEAEARRAAATSQASPEAAGRLVAELKIDSLSSEDNGIYRCRVDFRRARSRIEERELRIVVPAERPIIRDLTGLQATADSPDTPSLHQRPTGSTLVVGPHFEGTRLVLECETSGGYPEPELSWWRDEQLVDDTYELVSASDGRVLERRVGAAHREHAASQQANEDENEDEHSRPRHRHHHNHHHLAEPAADATSTTTTASAANSQVVAGQQQDEADRKPAGSQMMQNRLIRNRLELDGLSRADLLANYSCKAWNSRLGEPPAASAMIDMNLRPLRVQIDNERQPVLADKPLDVVCKAFGARPSALISWYRGSTRLRPTPSTGTTAATTTTTSELDNSEDPPATKSNNPLAIQIQETISSDSNVTTTSTLTFTPQLDDSSQVITCRAETASLSTLGTSQAVPTAPLEDSWRLEVHHLPRVHLALGDKLNGRHVREGHDVYFECSVRAQPQAHELRWWFNGKELETNVSSGVIVSNQSLVLQRIQRKQAGKYTCSAINSVGEAHSNSLHLFVQHAPYCKDAIGETPLDTKQVAAPFKTHYGVARMESVKVYCHVEANPSDSMSYKWAFISGEQSKVNTTANQVVYLDSSLVEPVDRASPLVSVATWTPKSELDYGTLLCWAQNSLGNQADPCAYQLVPAERPEPVRNCRLLNASDSQLAVACRPGYDGGIDQTFHMEVYLANNSRGSSRELIANVSSTSTGSPWTLLGSNEDPRATSTISSNSLEDGEDAIQDDESSPDEAQQPASLVSESNSTTSRLQKQRHSSQDRTRISSNHRKPQLAREEAVFLTEPHMLAPATDYLLSIYSSNSKGTSKPVAFTATTTNSSLSSLALGGRDGRRADSMIHEVFSLSWSPFLLVCAVTILIFILFASITFALMKYVDLTGILLNEHDNHHNSSGGQGDLSLMRKKEGNNANNYVTNSTYAPSSSVSSEQTTSNQQNHLQDVDCSISIGGDTSGGGRRARIIALGRVGEKNDLEIPLGELQQQQQQHHNHHQTMTMDRMGSRNSSALLDGNYLKFKLQQLTRSTDGARLKQSNSDNYLNQGLQPNPNIKSTGPIDEHSNWFHSRSPQYQAAYCNGTLPRNLMSGAHLQHLTLAPVVPGQSAPIYLDQTSGHAAAPSNPYGYLKVVSANNAPATSASQTPEANTDADHLTSLMLAPAATGASSGGAATQLRQHHHQQQQPQIEHLVISGKQYIHQIRPTTTTTTTAMANIGNEINPTCVGPLAAAANSAIQRHLQLTSGHNNNNNNNIDAKGAMPAGCLASGSSCSSSACSAGSSSLANGNHMNYFTGTTTFNTNSNYIAMAANSLRQQQQKAANSPVDYNYQFMGANECNEINCSQRADEDALLGLQLIHQASHQNNNNNNGYLAANSGSSFYLEEQNNSNSTQPASLALTGDGSPSSGIGVEIYPSQQQQAHNHQSSYIQAVIDGQQGSTSTLTSGNEIQSDELLNGASGPLLVCKSHLLEMVPGDTNGDQQMAVATAVGKHTKSMTTAGQQQQPQRPKKTATGLGLDSSMENYTILINDLGGRRHEQKFVLPDQLVCAPAAAAAGGGNLRSANKARVRLVSSTAAMMNNGQHQQQQQQQANELVVIEDQFGLIRQAAGSISDGQQPLDASRTITKESTSQAQDLQT